MVQSTSYFFQGLTMSVPIDIISCITDRFVELTATEKRIAQFILDDVQAATTLPIAEMAKLTDTSQASITRFARAIGCKDVRELKVKLAQSLAVGQRFILDVPDLEGVQGIYETIINVLEMNRRGAAHPRHRHGRRLDYLRPGGAVPPVPPWSTGGEPERRAAGENDVLSGVAKRCSTGAVAGRLYARGGGERSDCASVRREGDCHYPGVDAACRECRFGGKTILSSSPAPLATRCWRWWMCWRRN